MPMASHRQPLTANRKPPFRDGMPYVRHYPTTPFFPAHLVLVLVVVLVLVLDFQRVLRPEPTELPQSSHRRNFKRVGGNDFRGRLTSITPNRKLQTANCQPLTRNDLQFAWRDRKMYRGRAGNVPIEL
jgi:hypothetical protein